MTSNVYDHIVNRLRRLLGSPSELPSGNGARFKDQSKLVLTVYHSNLSQDNLAEIAVKPESLVSSLGFNDSQAENHIEAICSFTSYSVNPDPKYNWPRVGIRTINEADRVVTYLAGLNA
jgi:hypothetical protein